jgi:hypothetical protein
VRKIAAAAVAIPFILFVYVSSLVRRIPRRPSPQAGQSEHIGRSALPDRTLMARPVQVESPDRTLMARPVQVEPSDRNLMAKPAQVVSRTMPPERVQVLEPAQVVSRPRPTLPDRVLALESAEPAMRRNWSLRIPRAGAVQLMAVVAAVVLLVAGLLVGLPAKEVAGVAAPTFVPLAPQAEAHRTQTNLPLSAPFDVHFTKPMNEGTVESAVTISPAIKVTYRWDATAQVLSIVPVPHWQPYAHYFVDITSAATDQEGLGLANEIHTSFDAGSPTAGEIVATMVSGDLTSPASAFQLTFTRPVKLATVLLRFGIAPKAVCPLDGGSRPDAVDGVCPPVKGTSPELVCPAPDGTSPAATNGVCPALPATIVGDDPTDAASQVFTMTPKSGLGSKMDYVVSLADGGTDSAGSGLQKVAPLYILTMSAPGVVRFRPQDGSTSYDPGTAVSVRFTMEMDEKSTAAAFTATVNGKAVVGNLYWAQDSEGPDRVLVLVPKSKFAIGSTVIAKVGTGARSKGGLHVPATVTATFKVAAPIAVRIAAGPGRTASSPWYAMEVYYMNLMNCTRTGSWVNNSGACSTQTAHTLPPQGRLALDAGISDKVARPFAKYMADIVTLNHYAYHDPHWRMCNWGGYCGPSWGENIASPSTAYQSGMIAIELFYQNESWCRCEHYYNIMNPYFRRAGVGVWMTGHVVRVAIDFYG